MFEFSRVYNRNLESIVQARRWKEAQDASNVAERAERVRKDAAKRQHKHRKRTYEEEAKQGLRDPRTLKRVRVQRMDGTSSAPIRVDSPSPPPSPEPASKSPTHRLTRLDQRPVVDLNKRIRASPVNYFEPVRWSIIKAATDITGFSSHEAIVNEVQKGRHGHLFSTLYRATVLRWMNDDRTGWSQHTLERAAAAAEAHKACITPRTAAPGKKLGRPKQLDTYPSMAQDIIKMLTGMRAAGIVITRTVAQSVVLAFIRTEAPDLFNNPKFKCSASFIYRILRNDLQWTWRKGTTDATKLPDDWEVRCVDLAHIMAWNVRLHDIPAELVVNADQTGIAYLGPGSSTWEVKGSKQVSIFGDGDKRQFTLMVAVNAAGKVLPFQAIYKGHTSESLPSAQSQLACAEYCFIFTPGGDKYWSNLESMKIWVLKVLVPYIECERKRLGLPPTQRAILLLDCWAVHRGQPFRDWVKASFPWLIILFVPGGCTSVAQPCDTGINRPLKHVIKGACVEHLSMCAQKQLLRGIKPQMVQINTTPAALRNASVEWITSAWDFLNDRPEVVLRAWRHATFKEYNLSYEFITSEFVRNVVKERFADDIAFAISIANGDRQIAEDSELEEEDYTGHDDDYAIDPSRLCDIISATNPDSTLILPVDVVNNKGALTYIGDEHDTDDED